MRIVFATSELFPYSKTGGLADVSMALPKALAARGHELLIVTPLYGSIDRQKHELWRTDRYIHRAHLWEKRVAPGLRVAFLESSDFYDRQGIYGEGGSDYHDNAARFAFLGRAPLQVAEALGLGAVDILHLHDWQTGVGALELARQRGRRPGITRSVFTIHNMGYQGRFSKDVVGPLGLGWDAFTPEGLEFHDGVNYLKAGLAFSDVITTVSPTYAREIQTHEHGFGLDAFLRGRANRLHGILNGIDPDEWNPAADPHLPAQYSASDLTGKEVCRQALCSELGIDAGPGTLLLGIVSRFAQQKGFALILQAIPELMRRNVALAVLGSGEARFAAGFKAAAQHHRGRIGVGTGFNDRLAHRIEAGADAFLMPSLYEPCGLNQMYSLRYGTVPIVHRTGGLADTVQDHGEPGGGTGFCMGEPSAFSLVHAVDRANEAFHDRERWKALQQRGMARDFSWGSSARAYEELYGRALGRG